jgi:hypothetical protein
MKYTNKSSLEKITLANYNGRFNSMEIYLTDAEVMVVVDDDGNVIDYDEDDDEQITASAIKIFADFGDRCISISLVETYKEEGDYVWEDEDESYVCTDYIESNQLTNIKNPNHNGQNHS